MQILIIEDERTLRDSISEYLRENGYVCTTVGTLKKGLEKSTNYIYDCVLIDIGLPDGNGMDIISTYKKIIHTRVSLSYQQKTRWKTK